MKTFLRNAVAAVLILALVLPANAFAGGWVDEWFANATSNGSAGGYYKGQQRGYVSGGSYSARFSKSTVYPISVSTPRIKAGCGGIDVFGGGISFLNADYLVKQLQAILQNAPSVALDLALNVLCSQCAKSIKEFQSMMTSLNGLSLDSCKATQPQLMQSFKDIGSHAQAFGSSVKELMVTEGDTGMYDEADQEIAENDGKPADAAVKKMVRGCEEQVRDLLLDDGDSTLLQNIGHMINMNEVSVQMMAGLMGDVAIVHPSGATPVLEYVTYCEENDTLLSEGVLDGKVWLRDFNDYEGSCVEDDTSKNITDYVKKNTQSIAEKLKSKSGTLSDEEVAFLNTVSGDSYAMLKYGVQSGTDVDIIAEIAPLMAKDLTRSIINPFYTKMEILLAKANTIMSKQQKESIPAKIDESDGSNSSRDASGACKLDAYTELPVHITQMLTRVNILKERLNMAYSQELAQLNTKLTNMSALRERQKQLEREISRKFGSKFIGSTR